MYLQLAWKKNVFVVGNDDPWRMKSSGFPLGLPHNPSTLSSSKMEGVTCILRIQSLPTYTAQLLH